MQTASDPSLPARYSLADAVEGAWLAGQAHVEEP